MIGKCPATLSKAQAEVLLNNGIGYPNGAALPERIYAVHEGVVYEAVCSGGNWHGYPWRLRPGRKAIPTQIKDQLEQHARNQGCYPTFKKWMKTYGRSAS